MRLIPVLIAAGATIVLAGPARADECEARNGASVQLGSHIKNCGHLNKEQVAAIVDRLCFQVGTLIVVRYPTLMDRRDGPTVVIIRMD